MRMAWGGDVRTSVGDAVVVEMMQLVPYKSTDALLAIVQVPEHTQVAP